ncbi:branched-chain amino acid transport system ATP-binding protein [Bradyrhizobium sp. CIR3A]|nr:MULTISPECIES: ABC transporter ATP-binding protein [unclassified Bradyrhizobium]MBB4260554.1 branched-chain amino acid transport system ATP-binding protein [Bradyrhizobium sp. CIR3A]NYG46824.1 branched-chain amino acid transport system ATP-binding protein [Bradyrhizobium sp. IAR9]
MTNEIHTGAAALNVHNLHAWYGESHILHGMNLSLRQSEIVALLGRNGSGRTTTLRAIVGLVDRRTGSIMVHQREAIGMKSHLVARLGIGYCPEERGIFSSLSCEENLMLPPKQREGGMSLEQIYELLPNLAERRRAQGTRLSGGEQQMLAIARILRSGARILLLDEISEGLAPVIVDRLFDLVIRLKELGYTVLLVEQNKYFAQPLADRFLVVERGEVVMQLTRDELDGNADAVDQVLGI